MEPMLERCTPSVIPASRSVSVSVHKVWLMEATVRQEAAPRACCCGVYPRRSQQQRQGSIRMSAELGRRKRGQLN
jgi:hypothetical protein